jgi:hypothetical protein
MPASSADGKADVSGGSTPRLAPKSPTSEECIDVIERLAVAFLPQVRPYTVIETRCEDFVQNDLLTDLFDTAISCWRDRRNCDDRQRTLFRRAQIDPSFKSHCFTSTAASPDGKHENS